MYEALVRLQFLLVVVSGESLLRPPPLIDFYSLTGGGFLNRDPLRNYLLRKPKDFLLFRGAFL